MVTAVVLIVECMMAQMMVKVSKLLTTCIVLAALMITVICPLVGFTLSLHSKQYSGAIPVLFNTSRDSPWPSVGRLLWKTSIATTIWAISTERNLRIFRGTKCEVPGLFHTITSDLAFWDSNHKAFKGLPVSSFIYQWREILQTQLPRVHRPSNWSAPPEGHTKLNFDGCSLDNPGLARVGGVFRGHLGTVSACFSENIDHTDSQMVESMALLTGLKLFNPSWPQPLLVEGDGKNVISWAAGFGPLPWYLASFFDEISHVCRDITVSWKHIWRKSSDMTNHLAKDGATSNISGL
ncbi:uncharacterized protein LOC110007577 [Amborella trichopoda]|uniref:uncharacterized protein LOC110007577 n=1 Tax=Amborella trichopoda TaxID=13333 RepID=UPI0009C03F65|nr:uncharacterized protein LOC110007577 [Amborella trichopoda]|eukprot:XP_020524895.1 uncharacterized protein LOC110007577 [Amborella trichopoda]